MGQRRNSNPGKTPSFAGLFVLKMGKKSKELKGPKAAALEAAPKKVADEFEPNAILSKLTKDDAAADGASSGW